MTQGGFQVDKEGLSKAIEQLEEARKEADDLVNEVRTIEPGELSAYDKSTGQAREVFQHRMTGSESSLQSAAVGVRMRLDEKIKAYRAVLGEYEKADDNADVANRNVER